MRTLSLILRPLRVSASQRTPSPLFRRYTQWLSHGSKQQKREQQKRDYKDGRLPNFVFAALFLSFSVSPAFAADPGTTTGELLKIPVSARAIGMGEAYTALANDAYAMDWNPAGMAMMSRKEAAFMHSAMIESVHYEYASFVAPTENYALGTSLSYLGYGSIAGYDNNNGTPIGNINAYSYKFTGGLAKLLTESLSLGLSASYLHETLDTFGAGTFSFNGGALYTLPFQGWNGNYTLGASILNLGQGLKYIDVRDPLPRKIKFGAAATHLNNWPLTFTADVTKPNDNSTYLAFGSEYWIHNLLALRIGYTGENTIGKGLRLGVGLKYSDFGFDYAYGGFGDFGATHRIGASWKFGMSIEQFNTEERALLKEAAAARHAHDYVKAILLYKRVLDIDPSRETVSRAMVDVHEAMLKQDLDEAVAEAEHATGEEVAANGELPSAEDQALNGVIPGQQAALAPSGKLANPVIDPLGLENLPSVSDLDVYKSINPKGEPAVAATRPSEASKVAPILKEAPPKEDKAPAAEVEPATVPAAQNAVATDNTPEAVQDNNSGAGNAPAPAKDTALDPSDIYGQ